MVDEQRTRRASSTSSPSRTRRRSSTSSILRLLSPKKGKMDPDLRKALSLLDLRGLSALEDNFLKTDAFLRPWAHFRDNFLLLQSSDLAAGAMENKIARSDILYFYTLFDEGEKRYDPLADELSMEFTTDKSKYGVIDKSSWRAEEHEKLLYAWLLQSFKVGKVRNPYGFKYFECRNPCSAWESIILPIVIAVRKDYNARGRYHYGRLAKFIEGVSPSPLAFPAGNVSLPLTQVTSKPQESTEKKGDEQTDPITNVLLRQTARKTVWAEHEQELRRAYPLYGQMVERSVVKSSIEDWIQGQRQRMNYRKALEGLEGTRAPSTPRSESLAAFNFDFTPRKQEHTTQTPTKKSGASTYQDLPLRRANSSYTNDSTRSSPFPNRKRSTSDGLYSSTHKSNPFEFDSYTFTNRTAESTPTKSSEGKRLTKLSVTPKPSPLEGFGAYQEGDAAQASGDSPQNEPRPIIGYYESLEQHRQASWGYGPENVNQNNALANARLPSYEGNEFGDNSSMISLPTVYETHPLPPVRPRPTRIPSPTAAAAKDTPRKYYPIIEQATSRDDVSPAISTMPGPPPPIPPKNPKRYESAKGHVHVSRSQQLRSEEPAGTLSHRIVSKENIRAALGDPAQDEGEKEVEKDPYEASLPSAGSAGSFGRGFARIGGRGLNTGEHVAPPTFPTYNTHMFPRVGSPAHGTLNRRLCADENAYELSKLENRSRDSQEI